MTEKEYKEHIQYTHNAYCRIVIRHASIDAARMLFAKWKREISLEYLTEEKFVPLSTTDEYFQVPDYGETYLYNIMHSNCTRKERLLYSFIVILLPIIGIPIYYELREYNSKNNKSTSILNRLIDIILILISLWITLSMIVNQLSTDSILGRLAVIIALIYNLSIFSKRKKTKLILLLAAVLLLFIATIIKIRLT